MLCGCREVRGAVRAALRVQIPGHRAGSHEHTLLPGHQVDSTGGQVGVNCQVDARWQCRWLAAQAALGLLANGTFGLRGGQGPFMIQAGFFTPPLPGVLVAVCPSQGKARAGGFCVGLQLVGPGQQQLTARACMLSRE